MTVVIVSLILSVIPAFYFGYLKIWQTQTGQLGATTSGDFVLWRMQKEIRMARTVALSSDGKALTVLVPKQAFDTQLGSYVNALDSQGQLINGDQVRYYFVSDPYPSGTNVGALYRQVIRADGTQGPARLVARRICPGLNPLTEGTSTPKPIFAYDSGLRAVTVTLTVAEPDPSTGDFAVRYLQPKCTRDGGALVRVAIDGHPEGQVACTSCGNRVRPSAEIVASQTQFLIRNR